MTVREAHVLDAFFLRLHLSVKLSPQGLNRSTQRNKTIALSRLLSFSFADLYFR